jgi:hypothetical protein
MVKKKSVMKFLANMHLSISAKGLEIDAPPNFYEEDTIIIPWRHLVEWEKSPEGRGTLEIASEREAITEILIGIDEQAAMIKDSWWESCLVNQKEPYDRNEEKQVLKDLRKKLKVGM